MTKEEYDAHLKWMKDWHNKEYTIPWTPSVVQLEPATIPPTSKSSDSNEKQIGGRHYKRLKIQVWDYIIANDLDYFQGSITKYVTRWKDKGGVEDLHKAKHFLDKYIVTMEEKFKDMKERPDGKEDPKET